METNLEQWKPIGWLETKTKTRVETNSEKAKLVQWIKHSTAIKTQPANGIKSRSKKNN